MSVALIAENLSLVMPTRLADGLGLKGTPSAPAEYTPRFWVPRSTG
ncbi:hypothetical protein ES703_56626 [subsurface metagenome]